MPADSTFTANLRAALALSDSIERESPLGEVTTDSVDLYLDRINEHLAAGAPDQITDELLDKLADSYRAQAANWAMEEAARASRPKTPRKGTIQAAKFASATEEDWT